MQILNKGYFDTLRRRSGMLFAEHSRQAGGTESSLADAPPVPTLPICRIVEKDQRRTASLASKLRAYYSLQLGRLFCAFASDFRAASKRYHMFPLSLQRKLDAVHLSDKNPEKGETPPHFPLTPVHHSARDNM